MMNPLEGPMVIGVGAWIAYLIAVAGSRFAARSKRLRDHPNHRSSHTQPTPKTGGLAIIAAWLAGVFVFGVFSGSAQITSHAALLGVLALCALGVGLADDLFDMSPLWKFAGQFAVAGLFVAFFTPLQGAPVPFAGYAELGFVGVFLTVFWFAAFMNAYNFMDGANGLAAGSAALAMCGFCVIAAFSGAPFAAACAFLLAVALFGFLPVNLRRGRLFMGDNGSQAVSFIIAALAVMAANASEGRVSALVIPVIFLPFLFDVALTLAHRAIRRQNMLSAHREHLYQLIIRMGASHASVAVAYMAMTALSTAAAILMLALPAESQWLAPAALTVVFAVAAFAVYRRAYAAGLFADGGHSQSPASQPISDRAQQAAE